MSLNLINGFTGQFSLGHAGFMSIGAYSMAFLTTKVVPPSLLTHPVFFVVLFVFVEIPKFKCVCSVGTILYCAMVNIVVY